MVAGPPGSLGVPGHAGVAERRFGTGYSIRVAIANSRAFLRRLRKVYILFSGLGFNSLLYHFLTAILHCSPQSRLL